MNYFVAGPERARTTVQVVVREMGGEGSTFGEFLQEWNFRGNAGVSGWRRFESSTGSIAVSRFTPLFYNLDLHPLQHFRLRFIMFMVK